MSLRELDRTALAIFLNTSKTETKIFSLIGEGVQEQTINYNPEEEDKHYVHEKSGRTKFKAVTPTIPTPQEAIKGSAVFDYVDELRRKRAVASDAKTECLIVYPYIEETAGKYAAELCECTIIYQDFGGAAPDLLLNFDIKLNGDPKFGVASITDGVATFTQEA